MSYKIERDVEQIMLTEFQAVEELIDHFKARLLEYKELSDLDKEQVIKNYKYSLNYLCGWDSGINYDQRLYGATVGYIIRNVKEI